MVLRTGERIKESSTSFGTGNITLGGAVTGYQSFANGVGVGNEFRYCVTDGVNWEVGTGTLSDATTVTRDSILDSSNSGAIVDFPAGDKQIFVTDAAVDANPGGMALYIQPDSPVGTTDENRYLWIQTGLSGGDDDGITFWIEDGY